MAFTIGKRPQTICEALNLVNSGSLEFGEAIAEFTDEAMKMPPESLTNALSQEPPFIDSKNHDYEQWQDAYAGAVAEHLARSLGAGIPEWTDRPERFLARAWFDNHGLKSLNAMMVAQSPMAFRRRFIFTEAKPLRRA